VTLRAETAADLMTPNPVSVRETATVREAIALLADKGISGAPVIDAAGRPVGVFTQTDVLIHDREKVEYLRPPGGGREEADEEVETGSPLPEDCWDGFQIEKVDATPVRDLMTPALFSVAADTPARTLVEEMRDLNVHRLFVTDPAGVLIGVVSAMDVLRHLDVSGG
jgi:CBS domain-containing protein